MRLERSLAGEWQFQLDPSGGLTVQTLFPDRRIPVPLPWQAAFPELESYSGYAWYRRTVELDAAWLGGELLLTFGAVDYWCQVFINGQLAGEHEGGYTPFTLPIRAYVNPGQNVIAVRVYDAAQENITIPRWPDQTAERVSPTPPFEAVNIPHGKQEWYLNVGGIWQDVTLAAVPAAYLEMVHITPDAATGIVSIRVSVAGDLERAGAIRATIAGIEHPTRVIALTPQQPNYQLELTVPDPQWWTPDTPTLYTAEVTLDPLDLKDIQDSRRVRFGFRTITTRDSQILLNGEPLYLLCALDQDLYPDTIYTVPSEDYLRDQFRKAKELGLNSLRCHIKPPDPRYLDLADEMGLLIWAEIPSWRTFVVKPILNPARLPVPETVRARAERILEAMIARDYNHPSLIIWTIINEDWGTSLPLSGEDRAWANVMYDRCKQLDPTRLVVDNSPCPTGWGPNVHVRSDLDDFHIYTNIPDQADHWVQMVEQYNLRPLWSYSSHGDAQRSGREPLIISEFGNWGLPSLESVGGLDHDQAEPHWFKLGPWWSGWEGEPGWPRGVVKRLAQYGLNAIWPTYQAFAEATQWHQFAAMKFEIEALRMQPNLSGYVITEFTDAYWESNGLLDFYRCPKAYHQEFATINALDVIVARLKGYAAWDDQRVPAQIYGSHFSAVAWDGARLTWAINSASSERTIPEVARGAVRKFGVQNWHVPQVAETETIRVALGLNSADGDVLAQNTVNLLVLPARHRQAAYTGAVAAVMSSHHDTHMESESFDALPAVNSQGAPSSALPTDKSAATSDVSANQDVPITRFDAVLQVRGYQVSRRLSAETGIVVTDYPTADTLNWVAQGGAMLYLSSGPGPFFWRQGRGGTYGGSWLTSFSWLRPGVYRRLDSANPLSLPFMEIMPTGTLLGLPFDDEASQGDFLAGQISGWVNHPAVHTVQFRYGKGRVIMTTFRLKEALLIDPLAPVATAMLHDLIDHLTSAACQPTLRANFPV